MKTAFYCAIALLFVAASCKKYDPSKLTSTAWNPNFAIPLAYGNFDVYDIMARTDSNDIVIIDPATGAIALVYKGEIVSYEASDVIQISDYGTTENISAGDLSMSTAPSFSATASTNSTTTINPTVNAGVELYTMNFKTGTLDLSVTTTLQHDIDVTITIPELTDGGTLVSRTINMPYGGTIPHTGSVSIDLTNLDIDFTKSNTTFNELDIETSVTVSGTGNPVTGAENVSINMDFSSISFNNATGYFGQQNVGVDNDSILVKIFENSTNGFFQLTDPKVRFTVENSFGFPVEIDFFDLRSIDVNTNSSFPLSGYPNPLQVTAPSAIGQSATTVLELNTGNTTNIQSVVTPTPKYFYFEANGTSNPQGNIATNFVTDSSRFRVSGELELPLEGFAYGFYVTDTAEFSFSESVDEVESIMIRVNIDNGFPVEMTGEVKILDSLNNVLLDIFPTPAVVIEPAPVDANGRVTEKSNKITDILLEGNDIQLFTQAAKIVIAANSESLDGTDGKIVKVFDDYNLDIKVGMQVQGALEF